MAKEPTPDRSNSFSSPNENSNNANTKTDDENSELVESPHSATINKGPNPSPKPDSDYEGGGKGGATNNNIDHDNDNDTKDTDKHAVDDEESEKAGPEISFDQLIEEVDQFTTTISTITDKSIPLEIPHEVEKLLKQIESKMAGDDVCTIKFGEDHQEDSSFLTAINCLSRLADELSQFSKDSNTVPLLNQSGTVLHRGMLLMEDELRSLLDESKNDSTSNDHKMSSVSLDSSSKATKQLQQAVNKHLHHDDRCVLPDQSEFEQTEDIFPSYSPDAISTIGLLSRAMLSAGYDTECLNLFIIARRNGFQDALNKQGFEKISIDDVQRMQWEALEGEMSTWIRVSTHCSSHLFPGEKRFYESVFSENKEVPKMLFSSISRAVIMRMVNFAEAVAMTKRAPEKMFKFLDMYETLGDLGSKLDETSYTEDCLQEIRSDLSIVRTRLGEAVIAIFCELENSIRNDNTRTPVPSGAVHPMTRYIMNYLKLTCEYKCTLEEVFQQHLKTNLSHQDHSRQESEKKPPNQNGEQQVQKQSSFASALAKIMELLDGYLDSKSKLYKDPALRFIFLMNNGRYMLQKIKGAVEIKQVIGDQWCKRRSSDMRHYHKSYQRETWSRVLQCLNPEGLQVNGKVQKPILKERFKNFNQLFDEIHKTQSTWVVSDEQLQSEIRVSVSAVMIPAYRSFLARFGQQYFTPGRQYEKYIKYQPEDIESAIEELFDGNPTSMARRRT